jgi:hypothetical protein
MTKMTMTQNDHFWGKFSPQLGKNFSPVRENIFSNECPLKNAFCSALIFSKLSLQIKLFQFSLIFLLFLNGKIWCELKNVVPS